MSCVRCQDKINEISTFFATILFIDGTTGTSNSENPRFDPREAEFTKKIELFASWTSLPPEKNRTLCFCRDLFCYQNKKDKM